MAKNAIVGQSGGPTSVINASLAGVYESCKRRGAGKVYGTNIINIPRETGKVNNF